MADEFYFWIERKAEEIEVAKIKVPKTKISVRKKLNQKTR